MEAYPVCLNHGHPLVKLSPLLLPLLCVQPLILAGGEVSSKPGWLRTIDDCDSMPRTRCEIVATISSNPSICSGYSA